MFRLHGALLQKTLPIQSTQVQALEAAAQAAWRTGKGRVPQLGPVVGREALVWMRVQEEAVGGESTVAHLPRSHTPLFSRHLERKHAGACYQNHRTTISTKGPELSKP